MKVAVIGATGRTGHFVLDELLRRGHQVSALVRDPGKLGAAAAQVRVVTGTSRDRSTLADLVDGCDAVISALGPDRGDSTVLQDTARELIAAMKSANVARYVGIGGISVTLPGDRESVRDRILSKLVRRIGGEVIADKPAEYRLFEASDLDFTLVRPIRLIDGPPTGRVEQHAGTSPKRTKIKRADLAAFLVDVTEQHLYPRGAPLVANGVRPDADLMADGAE